MAGPTPAAPPLPGAIFTTTEDGTIVNENVHYEAKEDVYLDGGPGPNAPSGAAGLPEGDYYFQVTDPSGQVLLSEDHISCRRIHVNEFGVIDTVYPGMNLEKVQGVWTCVPCQHAQGVDVDHAELGAITVQLFPYEDTPNPGGVYKVWITPVGDYEGEDSMCTNSPCFGEHGSCNVNGEDYQPGYFHGFIPSKSKTDNYKVKKHGGPPCNDSFLTIRKFNDANLNCVQDEGEEDVTGWSVFVTDPTGVQNTEFTPASVLTAQAGAYTAEEDTPDGTVQTSSALDGANVSCYPSADPTVVVNVSDPCDGEMHEVVYGNAGLGSITACKVFDQNGNGIADEGEPPIEGWQFCLEGMDILGGVYGPTCQFTGEDGCTTFGDLLPGDYTVWEVIPDGYEATGPTSFDVTIESSVNGDTVAGTAAVVTFTNICYGEAAFGTKGYWHNKNGLQEIDGDAGCDPATWTGDFAYINTLAPYSSPSEYFSDGDEPFDGYFTGCVECVEPAIGDGIWQGVEVSPACSARAEVSQFLVDNNGGTEPREQLAQQLLAFIFNAIHRLGGINAVIELPDGMLVSASDLIDQAIAAWESGTDEERNEIKDVLDGLNNSDAVPFIPAGPCEFSY